MDARRSLLQLIEQLSKKDCNRVYIHRKDFSLTLNKALPHARFQ
jgi:hypothetical protein